MTTYADIFSGFGGASLGAKAAGLELAWSIEHDAAIADVAHGNLGHRVYVRDILSCDPFDFDAVDFLHASPPCPSFSLANANAGETDLDIALACKTASFVTTLKPRVFTLENVWAYRHSRSWKIIEGALHLAGYWLHVEHVNAASFGVPQTRKRMIVRAVRGGFVPYLPEPEPWVGWYTSIEDILHTLAESQFARWQKARLPALLATTLVSNAKTEYGDGLRYAGEPALTVTPEQNGQLRAFLIGDQERQLATDSEPAFTVRAGGHGGAMPRALLMPGGGNTNFGEARPGRGCRYADEPAHTVTTVTVAGGSMPRAWLVDSNNARPDNKLTIRENEQPAFTITSGGPKHPTRALFEGGRVVSMTPRALARFQSFPDTYQLPDNARLAAKGIGNAAPPLLMEKIFRGLTA